MNKQQQEDNDVVVADNQLKEEYKDEKKVTDEEVETLKEFAQNLGIERSPKLWRSILARADSLDHAKNAVESCVEYAKRPGNKVRNLDGLLFHSLQTFVFDVRCTNIKNKEDKYADLILNRIDIIESERSTQKIVPRTGRKVGMARGFWRGIHTSLTQEYG